MQILEIPTLLTGKVIHGDKVGRKLGFPTANLRLNHEESELAEGVYSAITWIVDIDRGIAQFTTEHDKGFVSYSYHKGKNSDKLSMLHSLLLNSNFREFNKNTVESVISQYLLAEYNPNSPIENVQNNKTISKTKEEKLLPYPTLLHIGPRSTFSDYERKYEAHIIGEFGNLPEDKKVLYDKTLIVLPIIHQRDSVKYEGVEKLVEQMEKDKEIAESHLIKK